MFSTVPYCRNCTFSTGETRWYRYHSGSRLDYVDVRPEKIDMIVETTRKRRIDTYMIQETWLEGEDEYFKELEVHGISAFFMAIE
jgi:hypothetical protein